MATKPRGGVLFLVAGPLRTELFFAASLNLTIQVTRRYFNVRLKTDGQ